jgi:hypothetical protein
VFLPFRCYLGCKVVGGLAWILNQVQHDSKDARSLKIRREKTPL